MLRVTALATVGIVQRAQFDAVHLVHVLLFKEYPNGHTVQTPPEQVVVGVQVCVELV